MPERVISALKQFDANLTEILNQFFKSFEPFEKLPFFAGNLTNFTKIIIYAFFLLAPLLPLKFLYPYNRPITVFIYFILALMALSLLGIIFAFFQIAYSF